MTDIINFCNELKKIISYRNIILVKVDFDIKAYDEDELEIYGYGSKVIRIPRTDYYIGISGNKISPRKLKGVSIISLEDDKFNDLIIFRDISNYDKLDNIVILSIGIRADISIIEKLMAPVAETIVYDLKGYKRVKTYNLNNYEKLRDDLIKLKSLGVYNSFNLYCRCDNIIKYTAKSTQYKEVSYELKSYEGYMLMSENEELDKEDIFRLYDVDNIESLQNKIRGR